MEELLVYALLIQLGFDVEEEYLSRLHRLFLSSPRDDFFLELENMTGNLRESADLIRSEVNISAIDKERFAAVLLPSLGICCQRTEIRLFAGRMYTLWEMLPEAIRKEPPFATLSYAGDSLQWGDEAQAKKHFEDMFRYLD